AIGRAGPADGDEPQRQGQKQAEAEVADVAPAGEDVGQLAQGDEADPHGAVGEHEQLGPALRRIRREPAHAPSVSGRAARLGMLRWAMAGRYARVLLPVAAAALVACGTPTPPGVQ